MRKLFLVAILVTLLGCENNPGNRSKDLITDQKDSFESTEVGKFGAELKGTELIEAKALLSEMQTKNVNQLETSVKGKILEVCQSKGCWMKVDLGNGENMRVTFKDYGFFVPKDSKGKSVIMEGVAKTELVDVETQRHYAEDAGKTQEEIESITEPTKEITFEAAGVEISSLD